MAPLHSLFVGDPDTSRDENTLSRPRGRRERAGRGHVPAREAPTHNQHMELSFTFTGQSESRGRIPCQRGGRRESCHQEGSPPWSHATGSQSGSSDLRVPQVHPTPPGPSTLALGTVLVPFWRRGDRGSQRGPGHEHLPNALPRYGAPHPFYPPPCLPDSLRNTCCPSVCSSLSLQRPARSVMCEAEEEGDRPVLAQARAARWTRAHRCRPQSRRAALSFTLAHTPASSAPPTLTATCGVIQDLDVTSATEVSPSSPALTDL